MIVVPTDLAAATAEIKRLTDRLGDRNAELDNIHAIHFAQCQVQQQQAKELLAYRLDVKHLRDELDEANEEIQELKSALSVVRSERDDWRAKAAVTR